jgi:hypothetical protein
VDIYEYHVRLLLTDPLDSAVDVVRFTDEVDASRKLGTHTGEEELVVVDDEDTGQ